MFFCKGSSEAPVLMFFCFLNEGWKDGNGKSAFLRDNFEVLDFTERIRPRKILSWNLPWLRSRNPVKTVRSVPSRKAATIKQCFWYVTFEAAINRMKTWKHGCKNGHFLGLIWLLNEFVCLNVCMFCDNLLIQSWEIDRQRLLGPKPAPLPDRRALRGASASGTDGGGFGGRCHWADGESKIDWTEEDISNIKGWSRTFRMPQVQL